MPRNAAEPLVSGAQECRVRRSLQTQPGIASLVLLAPDASGMPTNSSTSLHMAPKYMLIFNALQSFVLFLRLPSPPPSLRPQDTIIPCDHRRVSPRSFRLSPDRPTQSPFPLTLDNRAVGYHPEIRIDPCPMMPRRSSSDHSTQLTLALVYQEQKLIVSRFCFAQPLVGPLHPRHYITLIVHFDDINHLAVF